MQNSKPYLPKPVGVDDVQLSAELECLLERLAENAHEVWAERRFADGWKPGSERNDELKHHPCLVPYHELPESEKSYDRIMVEQTLKTILKLGYEIRTLIL
ncbi:MAG TPA: RyR domain-containing protein [Terracidiphilus sp.]|nr:RyR domain-containing protein [Terracidiphilus sp.]